MDVPEAAEALCQRRLPSGEPAIAAPLSSRVWRAVGHHAFVIPVFLVIAFVISWFVTQGTWKFFEIEQFGTYYDALADSICHGRLDVPEEAIAGEAFIRDGKDYGYFGMTPALFRIPLNAWWPDKAQRWSRISLVVASLVSVLYTYRIILTLVATERSEGEAGSGSRAGEMSADAVAGLEPNGSCSAEGVRGARGGLTALDRAMIALFLLCAGIGSTHVFLSSRPFIYHEAIAWGSTLALACGYYALRYVIDGKLHQLIEVGGTAFLAFFARPTAGAGAVLICALLMLMLLGRWIAALRPPDRGRWAQKLITGFGAIPCRHLLRDGILIGSFVAVTVVCYLATNYAKFRTFDGVPVKYYVQYLQDPHRMSITGGQQIHVGNFKTCGVAYFWRPGIQFRRQFPWMFMPRPTKVYPNAMIDDIEWASTIPSSMPWLFLLWGVGMAGALRGRLRVFRAIRQPMIGLGIGGSLILVTVGLTERYLHDIYPFFVLGAAAGLCWLLRSHVLVKSFTLLVLACTGLFAILANNAFALEYQRDAVWGVPLDRVAQFHRWRADLDALVWNEPLTLIETAGPTPPLAPVPGQLWKVRRTNSIYWHNGAKWVAISGPGTSDLYHLRVRFGVPAPGVMEPLLTRGVTEAGDFVYVVYLDKGRVQLGYDHWGIGGPKSAPVRVALDSWHDVLIDLDHINRCVTVQLDGVIILQHETDFYPARPDQVRVGSNPIGGLPTQPFSGVIELLTTANVGRE